MNDNVTKKNNEIEFGTTINRYKNKILNRNKHFNNLHKLYISKSTKDLYQYQNKSIDILLKEKYSNEKLFNKHISKGMLFYNKMNLKIKNNRNNNNNLLYPIKLKYNLSTALLSPINKNNKFNFDKKISFPKIKRTRTISPKKNISKSFDNMINYKENEKEKEKEKIIIRDNLYNLLYKIKQRIMPKRKLIFEKEKLPEINNNNNNINNNIINLKKETINKSCIHKEENYKGDIEFIKTHLDGIIKPKNIIKNKYKSEKRFEINEGYIDLEVLGEGENISYKTDIIDKKGKIYYIFHKKGGMDYIEEKIHKVKKDKKEFIKLLQKYNQNEIFQSIKAKDFNNIKKNYKTPLAMNSNIYKDLYNILFNNNNKKKENKTSYKSLVLY